MSTRSLCLATWHQSWTHAGVRDGQHLQLNAAGYAGMLLETFGSAESALESPLCAGTTMFARTVQCHLREIAIEEGPSAKKLRAS